jgi:hypothetical protein
MYKPSSEDPLHTGHLPPLSADGLKAKKQKARDMPGPSLDGS